MSEPAILDEKIASQVKKLNPVQKEQVLEFIEFLEHKNKQRPRPKFGSGKGMFEMSPDFDEPLDDFKEYME